MFRITVIKVRDHHWPLAAWNAARWSSTNVNHSDGGGKSSTAPRNDQRKMRGWQIHEYGDVGILQCNESIKIPPIKQPNEVLIKVNAASVNPIDVAMMRELILFRTLIHLYIIYIFSEGYGSTLLNAIRCSSDIEFPLTLGRDFCGVVTRKGMGVRANIQIGDVVWGVVPLHRNGCHAEYVAVDASCVSIT